MRRRDFITLLTGTVAAWPLAARAQHQQPLIGFLSPASPDARRELMASFYQGLAEAGLPVICVETRHMRAVLKAQINKTDRNDARGMAQMMRVGLYRPVHVKTLRSQKLRMLLTHRKLLQSKAIAIDNDGADTRNGHQAPTHVVVPDDCQQTAMQEAELLAKHPSDPAR